MEPPGFELFREFATDVMKFTLAMNGYDYDGLFEIREEWVPDTFEYLFGQAVFYYRQSQRERFEEMVQSYHDLIFHNETTLLEYIQFGIQQVTKRDSVLMDLLRVLAFYADLILYCQRFDSRKEHVALVAKYFIEIYNYAGIRDVLQVTGSYVFLSRVGEEIIGERVNEEPFVNRIMRYRQQLQQGSPDNRRVTFTLPEEGSPGTGRLASCLGMFSNMSAKHSEENGLTDEHDSSGSKPGTSSIHLNVPSTSGISVKVSSSTESEGEESESISERNHFMKSSSEIKKPQSILKSPHGIKGHKRTVSDDNASNKRKRTRTISSEESFEKTVSCSEVEDDPKNQILITISDTVSEELRASLEKFLEEILDYNKTNNEPVVYDLKSESSETSPKQPEEHKEPETEDSSTFSSNTDYSFEPSESSETIVSKPSESLKNMTCVDSSSVSDVLKVVETQISETKMDTDYCNFPSETSEIGVSETISLNEEVIGDFECSDLNKDTDIQNGSARVNTGSDSSVHSENPGTSLKLPESPKETENLNTPITDSSDSSKTTGVEITPAESDVTKDNQMEITEVNTVSDDYSMPSKVSSVSTPDVSLKVVTGGDSKSSDVNDESDNSSKSCRMETGSD